MANTKIYRTLSTPTNTDKGTISLWLKKAKLDGNMGIVENFGDNSNRAILYWNGDEKLSYYDAAAGDSNYSTAQFRDLSGAWIHIVLRIDSSQASASDRVRTYINGNLLSVNATIYQQNENSYMFNSGTQMAFGTDTSSNPDDYMEGAMSHIHYCDGQSYAPTEFGETDSTTGEWKIKTSPSVNYGSQGFFILKDGNSVTDQSGNGNNCTISGTLTKTEDCPSNVFATLNPLVPTGGGFQSNSSTFANGNTKFTTNNSSSNYGLALSTLGMTTGKYYAECKKISGGQGTIGIRGWQGTSTNNYLGDTSKDYGMYTNGRVYNNNSMVLDTSTSYADNDIIGVFVDCDNWKIYWSKNGTMMNTTGYTIGDITTDTNPRSLGAYFFGCCEWNSSGNGSWEWNFGNGAFGSTQLTGTTYNGSDGNGIFKYDPNNITLDSTSKSFKSLSTKGLNT